MLGESEAAFMLKKLIEKYAPDNDVTAELLDVIDNPNRPIPIRGALEYLREVKQEGGYTKEEEDLIGELLYVYG